MKKAKIILFVSLLLLLFFAGCARHYRFLEREDWVDESLAAEAKYAKEVVKRINNATSYENLITITVDIEEFFEAFISRNGDYNSLYIRQVDERFKIECLREKKYDIYSVFDIKQGGLLYIFWTPPYSSIPHNWGCCYVLKPLTQKDFASIREGMSITDVEKIDPVTAIYRKNYFNKINVPNEEDYPDYITDLITTHYLTDGILWISYTQEGETLKIIEKNFRTLEPTEKAISMGLNNDYSVFPQDQIKP